VTYQEGRQEGGRHPRAQALGKGGDKKISREGPTKAEIYHKKPPSILSMAV